MTHEEIDKLGVGREINALVAEAMGKLRRNGAWYEVQSPSSGWISGFHGKRSALEWLGQQYPYSDSISSAWPVLEKVQDVLDCHAVIMSTVGKGWRIALHGCRSDGSKDYGLADTKGETTAPIVSLAICRVALKAKLQEHTEDTCPNAK